MNATKQLAEDIFQLVKDPNEQQSIYDYLLHTKQQMQCKLPLPEAHLFNLKPIEFKGKILVCKKFENLPKVGSCIVQFLSGADKFYAQMTFSQRDDQILLETDTKLYRLQRREEFRIRIPRSYKAQFSLRDADPVSGKSRCELSDLSAGGCRIVAPRSSFDLKLNEMVAGTIHLHKRDDINIIAEVKHIAPNPENIQSQYFGLQFLELTALSKDKIAAVVMDLYRELFSTMK